MTVLAKIASPLFALAGDEESASFYYDDDNIAAVSDATGAIAYEYDEDGLLSSETYPDGSGVEYSYDELGNLVSSEEFASDDSRLSLASFLRMSYASPISTYFAEESNYNDNNQLAQYTIAEMVDVVTPEVVDVMSDVATATTSSIDTEVVSSTTEAVPTEVAPEASSGFESIPLVPAVIEEAVLELTDVITVYFSSASSKLAMWIDASLNRAWAEVAAVTEEITTPAAISTSTALYGISFSYDAQGNVIESRTTAGVVTTYNYDVRTDALIEKVVTTTRGEVERQTYQVDAQARIASSDGTAYGFTDGGMLAAAGAVVYSYDEYGNRSSQSGTDAATFTYSGNRLLQTTYASGRVTSYAYDERGAVSTVTDSLEGVTEFTYTSSGAVESVALNRVRVTYTYDALGRRVSRTSSTDGVWTYEYNGTQLKRVMGAGDVVLREYFYTPAGELTAVRADGALYHVVTSGNKSITGLVNVTTGELYKQTYDAWGAVVSSNFPITLDIGYIGAFTEKEFGVSVFGPRVYDPELGRFLSKDPLPGLLLDGLSQNEYIYAKNDPIHQYDPSGHASEIAQKSDSPKRALVETKAALELLRGDEAQAQVTYDELTNLPIIQVVDVAAYEEALVRAQVALEASKGAVESLEILYSLQVQAIEENETDAAAAEDVTSPISAAESVVFVPIPSESASASSTITIETIATSTVEAVSFSLPALEVVTEPELIASTTEVSTAMFGSVIAIASVVFGDLLLKAEAKKKKSKSKSKKAKQKSSKKAKEKQKKEAKRLAKQKSQLEDIKLTLLAMKVVVDKRVELGRQAKQQAENTQRNIEAYNAAQIANLSKTPKSPTMNIMPATGTCGSIMSCPPPSAGITSPSPTYAPTQSKTLSQYFTPTNIHYGLTACGFEQTFIGAGCGLLDGVLYAFEGDWTGAGLSAGSAVPFIGATGDYAKVTRLALIALRAEIATKIASGHALTKHLNEFQDLGIVTREQFVKHAESVISTPTHSKKLERGREVYFDQKTNTVLIHDPANVDLGTIFRQNIDYYDNLK
jgi:RHS repeat-associated protein